MKTMKKGRCMMKQIILITAVVLASIFSALSAQATRVVGGQVGNSGDTNPATFHFDALNNNIQLSQPDGNPINIGNVQFLYGTEIELFDQTTKIMPTANWPEIFGADLSGALWTDKTYPALGQLVIDPSLGRIKFSKPYWTTPQLIEVANGIKPQNPQVGTAASGAAICVVRGHDGSTNRIYAIHYSPSLGWYQAVTIDAGVESFDPQLVMNAQGQALCVFAANTNTYGTYYNPQSGWQPPVVIGTSGSYRKVAMNSTGRAIGVINNTGVLYTNAFDPSSGWSGETILYNGGVHSGCSVTMSGSIGFCAFVAYQSSTYEVVGMKYTIGGGWEAPMVSDSTNGWLTDVNLEQDEGNAFCLYRKCGASGIYRLYATRYEQSSGWEEPVNININNDDSINYYDIAYHDGQIVCLMNSDYNLWSRQYDAGWQPATALEYSNSQYSSYPDSSSPEITLNNKGSRGFGLYLTYGSGGRVADTIQINEFHATYGWQSFDILHNIRTKSAVQTDIATAGEASTVMVFTDEVAMDDQRLYASHFTNVAPFEAIPRGAFKANYYTSGPAALEGSGQNHVEVTQREIKPQAGGQALIQYTLAKSGLVTIKVYNSQGRLVKTIVNEYQNVGQRTYSWAATNDQQSIVASGIYLIHVKTPGMSKTQKVVVIK